MMPTNDLPGMLLETVTQHIPTEAAWLPIAAAALCAALGLVFMVKGARLAPVLAAIVGALLGAAGGAAIAGTFSTPPWPSMLVIGVVGLVLGVALFRLWLALLLGGCLVIASLGMYGAQALRDPVNDYLTAGLDRQQQLVTLPPAEGGTSEGPDPRAELAGLWTHLSGNVPNFQPTFFVIALAAGLAGLVFGLLLPNASRAVWAASLGTLLLLGAVYGVCRAHWPPGMDWLQHWGVIIAGALWSISLICNLADVRGIRAKRAVASDAKEKAA